MKYLVHIGYPKAASTWLQATILAGLDERIQPLAGSLVKDGVCKSGGDLFYDHVQHSDAEVSMNKKEISCFSIFDADRVRSEIESRVQSSASVTCLSNEAWSGHPYSGGIHGRIYLDRIKSTLPDAKILIVIRNPLDAIVSAYADYMDRLCGVCKFGEFLAPRHCNQVPQFSIRYYRYIDLIKSYDMAFGKENIIIVPFELLRTSARDFIEPIYTSLNISLPTVIPGNLEKNVRDYRSLALLESWPNINLLGPKTHANGNGGLDWRVLHKAARQLRYFITDRAAKAKVEKLKEYVNYLHKDFLENGNKELEIRTGLDLRNLGYFS